MAPFSRPRWPPGSGSTIETVLITCYKALEFFTTLHVESGVCTKEADCLTCIRLELQGVELDGGQLSFKETWIMSVMDRLFSVDIRIYMNYFLTFFVFVLVNDYSNFISWNHTGDRAVFSKGGDNWHTRKTDYQKIKNKALFDPYNPLSSTQRPPPLLSPSYWNMFCSVCFVVIN